MNAEVTVFTRPNGETLIYIDTFQESEHVQNYVCFELAVSHKHQHRIG